MIGEPAAAGQQGEAAEASRPPLECPACRVAQEAVTALLAQADLEGPTRGRGAQGTAPAEAAIAELNWLAVCNTHAWQLAARSDAAGRIAKARLRSALGRLDQAGHLRRGERFGSRRTGTSFGAEGDCPFCTAMGQAAQQFLEQQEQEAGDGAAPLCLPHLCVALELAQGRERVRTLARQARDQFTALEQNLSELVRKSDYRFRGEPRGQEAISWTRAALLLAGTPGVRWPLRRDHELEG